MQVAQYNYTGPRSTPQEIQDLRSASLDAHRFYGQPIIFKHRWNELDVQKGLAKHCPYDHNDLYGYGRQWDPYCFGTGFLGGFADGVVIFITFADAPTERLKLGKGGSLVFEKEPAFTAPWVPEMGDGDLIITGTFAPNTWDIVELNDRFILHEITPVTMRGFQRQGRSEFLIHQSGQVEKLPLNHQYYEVPLTFDYNALPDLPNNPPGTDPDQFPAGLTVSKEQGIFLIGTAGHATSYDQNIRITGAGSTTSHESAIFIRGTNKSATVEFS